jgi:hypothetical protein
VFDYDWFFGGNFDEQREEARWRCSLARFPHLDRDEGLDDKDLVQFWDELKLRTLIYLRDGFSYELKELAPVSSKSQLTFECEPVDEHYKVGAFVITVPFDDVVRVEVFAVHQGEMPDDAPAITGFRGRAEGQNNPQTAPPH